MEEKYWEKFIETGGLTEYLEYKMEMYGHASKQNMGERIESGCIDRNGAFYDTHRRI